MVFWVMLMWITLIGLLVHPSKISALSPKGESLLYKTNSGYCLLLWSVPLFFIIMCTGFGDRGAYIAHFDNSPTTYNAMRDYITTWEDSRLYYGIQGVAKILFLKNATIWFALIAALQAFCVTKVLQKYSENFGMSLFIFTASTMMMSWMCNGMRQFIAVSILFACVDWILEGRWIRLFIVTFILSGAAPFAKLIGINSSVPWLLGGVHQSAVIMFLVFVCIRGKAFNTRIWIAVGMIAFLAAFGLLESSIEGASSVTVFEKDLSSGNYEGGANPIRFLVSMVPVVMVLLKKKQIDEMDLPPIISLSINASVITAVLYAISTVVSGKLIGRLPIYTEMYNLILLTWLIEKVYISYSKWIKLALYAGYIGLFFYQVNITWSGSPYQSSLLGIH